MFLVDLKLILGHIRILQGQFFEYEKKGKQYRVKIILILIKILFIDVK